MNLVNLQVTKLIHSNPSHSYKLTTKKSEREIKATLLFINTTKRIKYLGIYLPKKAKYLSSENHKTLIYSLGPAVKSPCFNAGDIGLIAVQGTEIPHAVA